MFNADILGLILLDADLDNTDDLLGAVDTDYPTGEPRGLELGEQLTRDMLIVSSDRRTLVLDALTTQTNLDQIRVITAAGLVNTVGVSEANQTDPFPENNQATEITGVIVPADLSLGQSVDNPTLNEGDSVTYSIEVFNLGPGAATGVQVTDQLPAGLTFASASASRGTYDEGTGVWTVGTLASSFSSREFFDDATLTIIATVNGGTGGQSITNTAEVTSTDQIDPNSTPGNDNPQENDQASATIRVAEVSVLF
jgi:uncharacterized repeat protein (TIGR01451 family)